MPTYTQRPSEDDIHNEWMLYWNVTVIKRLDVDALLMQNNNCNYTNNTDNKNNNT